MIYNYECLMSHSIVCKFHRIQAFDGLLLDLFAAVYSQRYWLLHFILLEYLSRFAAPFIRALLFRLSGC